MAALSPQSSSCSLNGCQPGCRVADVTVSDQFPAGLRVLVVDDDPTSLRILTQMLRRCMYEVTSCSESTAALKLLREKKGCFDVVLSDVHMPGIDGFELLELVGLKMDLPVIMISADGRTSTVYRGIRHGACDYLIKPIRMEQLKTIWKHVVRKKPNCDKEYEHSASLHENDRHKQGGNDAEFASSVTEGSQGILKTQKKRRDSKEESESELENDDPAASKKPRVIWSVELHQQFVSAVNQLGIDKAVPKRILELMNVPGLTRENVASHLQKFRLYLKRLSGAAQQQGGTTNSFHGRLEQNPKHGSVGRFDVQALTASGQLPPQTLAALQAELLGRPTSNLLPPTVDQAALPQAPLQGPMCVPVDHGVSYGQPLKKPIISTEDGIWPSNNLGTVGYSGNLGGFGAQTGNMLMQNPQQDQRLQQHRQIILREPSGSASVEPSCLVVPTRLSSNFQAGNSPLSVNQNGSFDTVIDYSLPLPQSDNSLGRNSHGDFLNVSGSQGSYSADSNQVFDLGMLRNLGFVSKGVPIPSRFAVDETEQYGANNERKVKHEQNMEFVEIDKMSVPMLQHFSHNNLMSAFSE